MSIVKETLNQKLEELRTQHSEIQNKLIEDFKWELKLAFECIRPMVPYLDKYVFEIERKRISLKKHDSSWSCIEIGRPYEFSYDPDPKWSDLKLIKLGGTSSNNNSTEEDLIFNIVLGELSKAYLEQSPEWVQLCRILKEFDIQSKELLDPFKKQVNEIQRELEIIEKTEREEKFNSVLKQGFIEFEVSQKYYYGNGKRDYYYIPRLIWELNKGGKTMKISYQGKKEDGTWGEVILLKEREKVNNVMSFIRQNINK